MDTQQEAGDLSDRSLGEALGAFERGEIDAATMRAEFSDVEGFDALLSDVRARRDRDETVEEVASSVDVEL